MKRKRKQYLVYGLAVLLFAVVGIGFNLASQGQDDRQREESQQVSTKLNVALVNEDLPYVTGDGQKYSLGSSYVKGLERSEEHHWQVVSRATAESGLRNHDYQLMVVIPSNFSSKIADINQMTGEQATISYKVGSNGNPQVEVVANKEGERIVANLRAQLVDLYMASILQNLHTTQRNMAMFNKQQGAQFGQFESGLYQSTLAFSQGFPHLSAYSQASRDLNQQVLTSVTSVEQMLQRNQSEQVRTGEGLAEVIASGQGSSRDFGQLASTVLELDTETSRNVLDRLTQEMQEKQTILSQGLANLREDQVVTDLDQHTETIKTGIIKTLNEKIGRLKQQVEDEKKRSRERVAGLETAVKKAIAQEYGLDLDEKGALVGQLTVSQFVSKVQSVANLQSYSAEQLGRQQQVLQHALGDRLPDRSVIASLNATLMVEGKSPVSTVLYDHVEQFNRFASERGVPPVTFKGGNKLLQSLQSANGQVAGSGSFSYTVTDGGLLTLQTHPSTGLTVESVTVNGLPSLEVKKEEVVTIQYHYTVNLSAGQTDFELGVDMSVNGSTKGTKTEKVDVSNLQQIARDALIQQLQETYESADFMMDLLKGPGGQFSVLELEEIAHLSLDDYLSNLIVRITTDAGYDGNSLSLTTSLTDQIQQLEQEREQLVRELDQMDRANQDLHHSLAENTNRLANIRLLMDRLNQDTSQAQSSQKEQDRATAHLYHQLQSLLQSTASARNSSNQTIELVQGVDRQFQGFHQAVKKVEEDSSRLSVTAETLKVAFNSEYEKSKDFVASFSKVFNNAYHDGVANDVLIQFLSNPVRSESESLDTATNNRRPFTWILLLDLISLFVGYILAISGSHRKKVRQFQTASLWNGGTSLVLTRGAVLLGLIIGAFSMNSLAVSRSYLSAWILIVILFSIVLVHGHYLLIKGLQVYGMGVSLLVLISYIYLTSSFGTAGTVTGLSAVLKNSNILLYFESILMGYLNRWPAGLGSLSVLVVLSVLVISITIFFPKVKEKFSFGERHEKS
ncbi:type VII secretion protein EsaA [Streptococcus sp. DD13]|uniref:type VII secretion protein EsaA n=1 Tax=Streptococcus sp. DD13 TaxID=1777881 RepID=UPI00079AE67A|nr:type VII secretion protein EsaA [Streptococcus sp. DD13]KXT77712.1 hypothetical protein STRDD13_01392 [Streptococcus sp. DD13]